MEESKLHEGLVLAFVSFAAVDLFFKRSFERISWVIDKKENCLKEVIRPLIRILNNIEQSKAISAQEKNEVISLYEKVFPSPKETILKDIESLPDGKPFTENDEICFLRILKEVKMQKENFRSSTLSYGGMFLELPFADGVVTNLAVAIHFLKYIFWFPLFLYVYFYKTFTCGWLLLIAISLYFPVLNGLKSWKIRKDRIKRENLDRS